MTTSLTHEAFHPYRENPQLLTGSVVSIGRTFKNARRNLDLSQKTFAASLGVDHVWLAKLENDRLEIDDQQEELVASLLPALAEVLDLDLEWLRSLPLMYGPVQNPPAFTCYVRFR